MAKERKPRRKEKPGRISRVNLGTGWRAYDGDQVARDMSERRRRTIKTELAPAPSAKQYQEMLSRIEVLERLMAELPNQRPDIGHNRPPISREEVKEIERAVAILKAQPVVPTAPSKARAAGSTLKKIGERLGSYLLKQADIFISELVKSAAKLPFWWALATTLLMLGQSVEGWLR